MGTEVFIVSGGTAAQRVQELTRTIPIVAAEAVDLVEPDRRLTAPGCKEQTARELYGGGLGGMQSS
jgi:hypothetical protein